MKNNIFGYLFFLFIVIIMGFAVYKVNSKPSTESTQNNEISSAGIVNTQKGTEITLAISEFDTINPIISKNKKVQDISKLIFEPLINVTPEGKAEPCLAQEWETTDNMTYIIKLRTGVKWTDGTYFSSDDVKFTIDKLLEENKQNVYTESVKYLTEVDIIDNTTLKIILSQKIPYYQYYLTFPILSSNFYGSDDFWNTEKNNAPITTGRFQISETTGNTIILTKNINWWNKEKNESVIEKVTINLYSTVAELYNAFKLGGIDLIATTNDNYKNYIGKIGYNVTEIEGRNFAFLALNNTNSFLSDVNVRKALKCAINRDEIVSNIYKNSYAKANFPLLTSSFLLDEKNENYFNLGEMERYLKEAGWNLKNKHWQKNIDYKYKTLEFTMVVRANSNRVGVAEYIKNSLAEQGITINIIKVADEEYVNYINNKNYDILLVEIVNPISPDVSIYFSDGNLANYNNNEAKEIINAIYNITNEEELKGKYKRLYEIYNNEVPYIGIGRNKIHLITNSYLNGKIEGQWYNLFFGFKDWYKN